MNTRKTTLLGSISLLSVLGLELLCDHYLLKGEAIGKSILFYSLILLLLVSVVLNFERLLFNKGKLKDVLKTLIKNTISGNVLDLLFVLYFLLHVSWISDSIFEWVKDEANFMHPLIFISGLIIVVFTKPNSEKRQNGHPSVLLTGISNLGEANIAPLIKPFEEFGNIEKLIIFIDKSTKSELKNSTELPLGSILWEHKENLKIYFNSIIGQLANYQSQNIVIECHLCNYNDLKGMYDVIASIINKLTEAGERDKNLLFNLTPGTKYISIALALNSIKGERQYCYMEQDSKKLQVKALDIFEIKDIFSELTD